ncbi:MAG: hypothetical protein NVSMB2_17400 [Chloroflexota bacterium]
MVTVVVGLLVTLAAVAPSGASPSARARTAMQGDAESELELVAASDAPIELSGELLDVDLTPRASPSLLVGGGGTPRQVLVSVEGIATDQDPGFAYAVYLATPAGDREHIGNVSLFGISRQSPDQPVRQVFDATAAVDILRGHGTLDQNAMRVSFEPIVVSPPPGQPPTTETTRPAVPQVHIERVGVFVL